MWSSSRYRRAFHRPPDCLSTFPRFGTGSEAPAVDPVPWPSQKAHGPTWRSTRCLRSRRPDRPTSERGRPVSPPGGRGPVMVLVERSISRYDLVDQREQDGGAQVVITTRRCGSSWATSPFKRLAITVHDRRGETSVIVRAAVRKTSGAKSRTTCSRSRRSSIPGARSGAAGRCWRQVAVTLVSRRAERATGRCRPFTASLSWHQSARWPAVARDPSARARVRACRHRTP